MWLRAFGWLSWQFSFGFGWHYPRMGWGREVLRNMEVELKYELNVFVVNDTDNFKQDISIDVYGRAEEEINDEILTIYSV